MSIRDITAVWDSAAGQCRLYLMHENVLYSGPDYPMPDCTTEDIVHHLEAMHARLDVGRDIILGYANGEYTRAEYRFTIDAQRDKPTQSVYVVTMLIRIYTLIVIAWLGPRRMREMYR